MMSVVGTRFKDTENENHSDTIKIYTFIPDIKDQNDFQNQQAS